MQRLDNVSQQVEAVKAAPVLYIGVTLVLIVVIFSIVNYLNKAKHDRLKQDIESEKNESARLRGRLSEFEQKLDSSLPDEAKARIDALEQQIRATRPRFLSPEQKHRLTEGMKPYEGTNIYLDIDQDHHESCSLRNDFHEAFFAANWNVHSSGGHVVYGLEDRTPGLRIFIADPARPSLAEKTLMGLLDEFELSYKVEQHEEPGIRIFITARF